MCVTHTKKLKCSLGSLKGIAGTFHWIRLKNSLKGDPLQDKGRLQWNLNLSIPRHYDHWWLMAWLLMFPKWPSAKVLVSMKYYWEVMELLGSGVLVAVLTSLGCVPKGYHGMLAFFNCFFGFLVIRFIVRLCYALTSWAHQWLPKELEHTRNMKRVHIE